MRKYLVCAACFLQLAVIITAFNYDADETAESKFLLKRLTDSLTVIKTASYTVENKERVGEKYMSGSQYIHYQKQPFLCKIEFLHPNKGSQVIFGANKADATYSPIGFPYFDMDLNPLGTLMRRNNHHTVYEVGFDYIISIITSSFKNNNYTFDLNKSNERYITVNVQNPKFDFVDYTIKANEDVRKIALSRDLNEYLILELNNHIDFYDDVKAGDIIKIPNSYAKQVKVVFDFETFLIRDIFVYDHKGLFEEYHYRDIKKNIKDLNFDLDN